MPKEQRPKRKPLTRVSVRAEHRDKPDWDRLAWALVQYARILVEAEDKKAGKR